MTKDLLLTNDKVLNTVTGKEYKMLEEARLDPQNWDWANIYNGMYADARDEKGEKCTIYWDFKDGFNLDVDTDLGDACDWDYPTAILY